MPFVELNRIIERIAGCDVGEVHALYGSARVPPLRNARARGDRRRLSRRGRSRPAAGIVSEPATFDLLLKQCFTVWLRATPEEHMKRVVAQGDLRPMAGKSEAMEDLKRILAGREAFYAKADLTFDTSGRSLADAFLALRGSLPRRWCPRPDAAGIASPRRAFRG